MKTPYDSGLRVRKQELDDLRRELAGLYSRQDELEAALMGLEAEVRAEADAATTQPFANFVSYIGRQSAAKSQVRGQIDTVVNEIERMQEVIAQAFADFKTLDIAAERFIEAEHDRLAKLEQAQADEAALMGHYRNSDEAA